MSTYAMSGAASGIAAATRARIEEAGHRVIGIDLHDTEVVGDLSTPEGRSHAVEATLDLCGGRLDGLVTAAGVGPPVPGPLVGRVNYFGSLSLLEGLRPALAAAGESQVVQIGSNSTTITPNIPDELVASFLEGDEETAMEIISGVEAPFDSSVAYAASKVAITKWCRRAAVGPDWIGAGISLNVIAPGAVQTPLLEGGQNDAQFGPLMEMLPIPVGGPADPDVIAEWIMFMLSPPARFACGSVLFVDGGSDAVING